MESASSCHPSLRVAMFNISMSDCESEKILALTANPNITRLRRLAAIIQHAAPDVILLCEFDHLGAGGDDGALANFCDNYLSVAQYEQHPIEYPYRLCPATNTGLLTVSFHCQRMEWGLVIFMAILVLYYYLNTQSKTIISVHGNICCGIICRIH